MKNILLKVVAGLMFLAGVACFLYPSIGKLSVSYQTNKEVDDFERRIGINMENVDKEKEKKTENETDKEQADLQKKYDTLLKDFQTYNQKIYEDRQMGMTDPFDYKSAPFEMDTYGLDTEMIATIWVPRLDVKLPVYLGANAENMRIGASIMGQTSMPVGGINTNIVIAAHRGGGRGTKMFRDIQLMQIGDKIQLTTPWDTMIYRVCELKIVPAGDVNAVFIQDGRELLTLLTCHPYTQNTHRYLVFAERSEEEAGTEETDLKEAKETLIEENREVVFVDEDGVAWEEQVEGLEYSNMQIWLEDYGVHIVLALVLVVIASLLISSKKKRRKGRR